MKYLAISNNAWGKGETIPEAKKLCKKNGGIVPMSIYSIPDDYYIDEMGNAHGSAVAYLISGKDYRRND